MKVQKAIVAEIEEKTIPLNQAAAYDDPEKGWKLLSVTGKPGKKQVLVQKRTNQREVTIEEAGKLTKDGKFQIVSTFFVDEPDKERVDSKSKKGGK